MAGKGMYFIKCDFILQTSPIQLPEFNHFIQDVGSSFKKCKSPEDFDKYIRIYNDLLKLGEGGIPERTGCLPSCERNEYSVRRVQQKSTKTGKNKILIDETSTNVTGAVTFWGLLQKIGRFKSHLPLILGRYV